MTAQQLSQITKCYRIGDPDGVHPIFDPTGSKIAPGRWNTSTSPMIYTSEHYSTAMLEKLVHGSGMLPPNQHFIEILLPPGLSYEELATAALPGWADPDPSSVSRTYGEAWYQQKRSVLLFVPSVVARLEWNILINPDHPEFPRIQPDSRHHPVWWDTRLFPGSAKAAPSTATAGRIGLRGAGRSGAIAARRAIPSVLQALRSAPRLNWQTRARETKSTLVRSRATGRATMPSRPSGRGGKPETMAPGVTIP